MKMKLLAGVAIVILALGVSSSSISHIAFADYKSPKEVRAENQQEGKQKAYDNAKDAHKKTTEEMQAYKGQGGATSPEDVKDEKVKQQEEAKAKSITDKTESHEKTTRELKPYPKQGVGAPEDVKAKKLKAKEDLEQQSFANAKDSHEKTITKLVARR